MLYFLYKKYHDFHTENLWRDERYKYKLHKFSTPLLNEWNNSIYNFNKNKVLKNIYLKNDLILKIINNYFNLKIPLPWIKKNKVFTVKTFLSKQYVSHTNNKIYITLCIYNKNNKKKKTFLKKYIYYLFTQIFIFRSWKINKSSKKRTWIYTYALMNSLKKRTTKAIAIKKIPFSSFSSFFNYIIENKNNINIDLLLLKYEIWNILRTKYRKAKYRRLYLFIEDFNTFKLINYEYNINNFLGIKNILYKIYKKEIELNIINLKYLYLDSFMLNKSLGLKLKYRDRKSKITLRKHIIKAISMIKLPKIRMEDFEAGRNKKKFESIEYNDLIQIINPSLYYKNNVSANEFMCISTRKLADFLRDLESKVIIGIRVRGTGRLTRRLTASRSVTKVKHIGSLNNKYFPMQGINSVMLLGYLKSNLQYIKKTYSNRLGGYSVKTELGLY